MSRGRMLLLLALLVGLHGALHEPVQYLHLADAAHAARATWGKVKGEDVKQYASLPQLLSMSPRVTLLYPAFGLPRVESPEQQVRTLPVAVQDAGSRAPPSAS